MSMDLGRSGLGFDDGASLLTIMQFFFSILFLPDGYSFKNIYHAVTIVISWPFVVHIPL